VLSERAGIAWQNDVEARRDVLANTIEVLMQGTEVTALGV
jgi:hypothetical protein